MHPTPRAHREQVLLPGAKPAVSAAIVYFLLLVHFLACGLEFFRDIGFPLEGNAWQKWGQAPRLAIRGTSVERLGSLFLWIPLRIC